jgi:hypothetical protein
LLEKGETESIERAIKLLTAERDPASPPGRADRLLGIAYFRLERYGQAATHLRRALDAGQASPEVQRLLDLAVANDLADVARPVPAPTYFDAATLLAGPKPGSHFAAAPAAREQKTPWEKLRTAVGELAGLKLGETLGALTRLLGREPRSDSPWTTWYGYHPARSILMLAARRDRLNREQLFAAYPAHERTAFAAPAGAPPAWTRGARSSDGSYNDLSDPMAGAAGVRFGYNTEPERTLGETGERLLTPNPRTVSRVLMTRTDGFKPVPFLNLTAAAWIQFMNHDWVSHGDPADAEPYRIPLDEDDPVRRTLHQTHMLVRPTQADPTKRPGELATTHINEVTAWWDGSQIYGSDATTADSLRSFAGGKLAIDPKTGLLPVADDGVEKTGFRRNWWVGLSMLHHLFVKEHNAICDMLALNYPSFDDQRLYDTARLINAAVMAKIHTVEWTPSILPNAVLNSAMNSNWYGFLTNLFRSKGDRRTLATINVADPIAGGLVGNATDTHGVPYSLSREFVAVYRLHSLLPDFVELFALGGPSGPARTLPLAQLRQAASYKLTKTVPMDELFYSFGRQHPGQLVLNNYPETLQNLSIPGAGFYDLAAVDVLRDRERGVPRYNQFRRLLGLKPIHRFEDLTDNAESVRALRSVYASVEDLDLLVGNLAEAHRPTGFGFGETLFEIFILNASRRLQADRFFTEYYRPDVYTAKGLEWIDGATLKTVLLRHHPRLHQTGLANVDNAFEPWDVGPLDPARHPLRQFDKELRHRDEQRRLES